MSSLAYSSAEMMTIAASRGLKNGTVCFVGIGIPSAAANLARLMHAPEVVLIYESGTIGAKPSVLPLSIGDGELAETADTVVSVPEIFRYWLQGGRVDVGFLGAAQIDSFGRINTTVIGGTYEHPRLRLPGAGGAPEIATSAKEIWIVLKQSKRSFVDQLSFVTSSGFVEKPVTNPRARGRAQTMVVSDLCVMRSDPATHELQLIAVHPGVTVDQVRENTGWDLKLAYRYPRNSTAFGRRAARSPRSAAANPCRAWRRHGSRVEGRQRSMEEAVICDGIRTPFGRLGGALSSVRPDDLAAFCLKSLMQRSPQVSLEQIDDVILGCANQAGEDNRNVARMALLLAGLPETVPGTTVNRLCGSSMDAIAIASRAIRTGEMRAVVAGGVESMSRAPYVMGKPDAKFARNMKLEDTTLGWRFVNPAMAAAYGVDSMAETAENVAAEFGISRKDQDAFAFRSQRRAAAAADRGDLAQQIVSVSIEQRKAPPTEISIDEHPRRDTTLEALAGLRPVVRPSGTVTAGNASGLNDGAAALLLTSRTFAEANGLKPRARVIASAVAGVAPRLMGMGPVPATRRVLALAGLSIEQMDVIELNEAFAAQAVAVLRELGVPEDAEHVNSDGGAIALGHPLGASGARLVLSALLQLERTGGRFALCTMCIGVGQGISMILERI